MPSIHARLAKVVTDARRMADEPSAPQGEIILRRLVHSLPFAALVANNDGRYVVANGVASELTGYSNQELLDLSVWELTRSDEEHDAEVLWRAFLERGEQTGGYLIVAKDGHIAKTVYAARAHVLPGLHLSLMRRDRH